MQQIKRLLLLLITAAALSGGIACSSAPPPPPPSPHEVRSVRPTKKARWVGGHWNWVGRRQVYVWVPGHWAVH